MELPSFKINTKLRDSNGIKKIVTGVLAVAMMLAPTLHLLATTPEKK